MGDGFPQVREEIAIATEDAKVLELVVFNLRAGASREDLLGTVDAVSSLSREARRLYLLGEVLAVPDRVGAEVARVAPATSTRDVAWRRPR